MRPPENAEGAAGHGAPEVQQDKLSNSNSTLLDEQSYELLGRLPEREARSWMWRARELGEGLHDVNGREVGVCSSGDGTTLIAIACKRHPDRALMLLIRGDTWNLASAEVLQAEVYRERGAA